MIKTSKKPIIPILGYGNITPKTKTGKLTVISYALVGICLTMALVMIIGEIISSLMTKILETFAWGCVKQTNRRMILRSSLVLFLFSLTTILGSIYIMESNHQDLSFLDSIYYTFQTITTIGYGDVAWPSDHNIEGIIYPFLISLLGLGMIASIYSSDKMNPQNQESKEQQQGESSTVPNNTMLRNMAENCGFNNDDDGNNNDLKV